MVHYTVWFQILSIPGHTVSTLQHSPDLHVGISNVNREFGKYENTRVMESTMKIGLGWFFFRVTLGDMS